MTKVRLLPALVGVAGLALIFKFGGIVSGVQMSGVFDARAEDAPKGHAAKAASAQPESAPVSGHAATTAKSEAGTMVVASAAGSDDTSSKGEADVLHSLGQRRKALDALERELSVREQTIAVAERRIVERIAELKAIELRLNTMLGQRDEAQAQQILSLVKMYESMKPGDAAKIFEKMDRPILLSVSTGMKPAKLGAILAQMEPGKAQDLTVLLANRLNAEQAMATAKPEVPEVPVAAAPPVPTPVPPAAPLVPDVLPATPAKAESQPQPQASAVPAHAPAAATPTPANPVVPSAPATPPA